MALIITQKKLLPIRRDGQTPTSIVIGSGSFSTTSGGGASALNDLTDVVISSPATGNILIYTGSTWCNKPTINISSNVSCGQVMCYNGTTITGVTTVSCAANATNASLLCGCSPSCFAATTHCHSAIYYSTSIRACGVAGGTCICGCAWATDYVASSDKRLKTAITPIYNALSTVDRLCGVNYKLCADNEKCRMGMIAQDVIKIVPEVVTKGQDNMLGIDYSKIVPLLVEAIKEMKKEITNIKYGY